MRPLNPGVLTPDQLQRLARLCEVTQEAYPYTLDHWIDDFIGENRPENEIRIVEAIAVVYLQISENTDFKSEDKQGLYRLLCILSLGMTFQKIDDTIPEGFPKSAEMYEMFCVARAAGARP